ncbi:hypothetical protein [Nonomuraea fuscirosea]
MIFDLLYLSLQSLQASYERHVNTHFPQYRKIGVVSYGEDAEIITRPARKGRVCMTITGVQNVFNVLDADVLFVNLENSGNNRFIPAESSINVGNCWVPWATSEPQLLGHALLIVNAANEDVLWYIWQRHVPGQGNFVRASNKGWDDPGEPLRGEPEAGHSINLMIFENRVKASRL